MFLFCKHKYAVQDSPCHSTGRRVGLVPSYDWDDPTNLLLKFSMYYYLYVCLTKSEHFLNGTDGPATAGRQTERSGGQKGRRLGGMPRKLASQVRGKNFCPPSLSAAAEFRASETGAPPKIDG